MLNSGAAGRLGWEVVGLKEIVKPIEERFAFRAAADLGFIVV